MIHLRAPAKLNLYLRVLARRPDGYHELETLLERIDLADELTLSPLPDGLTVTCDEPTLPVDEGNLITQAARLLKPMARTRQGATIHLRKRIPIAAGLGGGSSDAAATLVGLNDLWQLGLDQATLMSLAAQLGSDVPFFLCRQAFAIGRGRGEVCEPLPSAGHLIQVLVVPEARLSTRAIYASLRRRPGFSLTAPRASITMMLHALRNGSLSELAKGLWNDLEPEAIRRCPISALIQLRLREHGCVGTLVSGSGPAVFGLCRDLSQAQEVTEALRSHTPPAWRVEIVQTQRGH